MMDMALLERLCRTNGVSGDEGRVREIILSEIKDCADSVTVDGMGNVLAFKQGRNPAKTKLLLSAHMDEVGFIVTDITRDGMLSVEPVGGIDRRVVCGKPVTVGPRAVKGVFGIKPIHLLKPDEKDKMPPMDKIYIDIGAENKEQAEQFIDIGDYAAFDSPFICKDGRIISKALDDRAGCLVLIEMLKTELQYDMYFSFVVQEEVGLRGAKAAAYTLDPEAAIVVETTTAADAAGVEEQKQVCRLREGAVISFMDKRTIYDSAYYKLALAAGREAGVKTQPKQAVAGGNDAGAIHCSRGGVRTAAVSLPCRYLHSACTVAAQEDLDAVYVTVLGTAEKIAGGNVK